MTRSRKLVIVALGAAAISIVADVFLTISEHHATPLWGSGLLGYWPVFAVFWFAIFVFGSKWLGTIGVQQGEDYYRGSGPDSDTGADGNRGQDVR